MHALPLRIALALTCLHAPALAGVHIVDATGRGDHATIAAAVAAASDGDLLLVRSGTYAGFVVDDKALVIALDVGALVTIEGTIEIANLAAGKTLVLADLVVHGPASALGSGPALSLVDDAGRVRIEGCELDGGRGLGGGGNPWNPGAVGADVQGCLDASFVRCAVRGGDGEGTLPGMGFFDFGGDGGDAVHASSSSVAAFECALRGGAGGGGEGLGGDGGRGYDHELGNGGGYFSHCTLQGGDGGYAHGAGIGGHGGDALFASSAAVHTLLDCTTLAGTGGASTGYPPGQDGQEFAGAGTYRQLPGSARTFSAGFLAASGRQVSVEVHGQAGDRVYVIPGGPGSPYLPGLWSSIHRPKPAAGHCFVVLSHTGTATFLLPLPRLPAGEVTRTLAFQGYVLDASGAPVLGNPFHVELLRCASLLPDCNGNGAFDSCDLLDGSAQDLGHDGIPDSCDPDCNGNGLPDDLDILNGNSPDANGNGIPDPCEGPHVVHVDASAAPFGDGSAAAPFQTISQGIAAAATGDVVRIEDGTYTGALNREMSMGGRSIVIESAHGPAACVVDCQTLGRAFALHEGEIAPMAIRGLTIRNGRVKPQSWNPSRGGGAIVVDHSSARLEECVFETCFADQGGGAVFGLAADLSIVRCTFRDNGQLVGWAPGGALRVGGGTLELSRSVFEHNLGSAGGALDVSASTASVRVSSCSFRGNSALIYGGGVVLACAGIVDDCLVAGNSAPDCGGLSGGAGVWILNSTIAQNSATHWAGGLYAAFTTAGGQLRVRNSLIWGNSAPTGGQIGSVSFFGTLQLRQCDLQDGAIGIDIPSGILDYDASNIEVDPLFVSPGGPDGNPATWADNDLRLTLLSPCIDAGDNSFLPNDQLDLDQDGNPLEPLPLDLDGAPRRVDIPSVIDTGAGIAPLTDIGAYERQP